MELDPVAVALKFGFLAVLYLFLLWMARSALKDLRRDGAEAAARRTTRTPPACTTRPPGCSRTPTAAPPKLRVATAAGLRGRLRL